MMRRMPILISRKEYLKSTDGNSRHPYDIIGPKGFFVVPAEMCMAISP